jgi:uncharacterized protein DUF4339
MSERGAAQDQSWYLARDGQQLGPFAGLELLRLAEAGQVRASDLVWKPGFDDWQPVSALAAAFAPQPKSGKALERRQQTQQMAPEESAVASLAREQSPDAIEFAPDESEAPESAPSASDQAPGDLGQWIDRIPYRFARNAALIGAIPGVLVGYALGVTYLIAIVIGFTLAALLAGFSARVYLRRLEFTDETTALAASNGLPLRYATAAAVIGVVILALNLAQKLAGGSYSPGGAGPVILTFVIAAIIYAAIGFSIGLVHRSAIVNRALPA